MVAIIVEGLLSGGWCGLIVTFGSFTWYSGFFPDYVSNICLLCSNIFAMYYVITQMYLYFYVWKHLHTCTCK